MPRILIFILLLPICSLAQSLSVNVQFNPNFTFSNTTALEAAAGTSPYTLISNSFIINVSNANVNTGKVYIALESPGISTGSGTPMAVGTLKVKFNHTDAPAADYTGLVTADVPMTVYGGTGSPGTLLFTQKKKNATYHYYYDVKLPLIGYSYAPGSYNYTFRVTMSVP